jgi:hypothetical protein
MEHKLIRLTIIVVMIIGLLPIPASAQDAFQTMRAIKAKCLEANSAVIHEEPHAPNWLPRAEAEASAYRECKSDAMEAVAPVSPHCKDDVATIAQHVGNDKVEAFLKLCLTAARLHTTALQALNDTEPTAIEQAEHDADAALIRAGLPTGH